MCRTRYPSDYILTSIGGIFLKLSTSFCPRMPYKMFGCDRSVIEGTLYGEQSTLVAVCRLKLGVFFKLLIWLRSVNNREL
jgi:hypothetical protein